MSVTRRAPVQLVSLAIALTVSAAPIFAKGTDIPVPAGISVVEGNPSDKGALMRRLRFTATNNEKGGRYVVAPPGGDVTTWRPGCPESS